MEQVSPRGVMPHLTRTSEEHVLTTLAVLLARSKENRTWPNMPLQRTLARLLLGASRRQARQVR